MFIGECKGWGFGEMPVVKFMKSKLAEGKWNIHRMVREVSTVQAWNQAKDKIVERSKVEPIIGVCYMVGEKLNKAALGSIIDDCMQSVKPCHAQIICTPCYDFDWSTADNNKKTAWTTTAKFCADMALDKHIDLVNICRPAYDRNYGGKDNLWFMKQLVGELKHLLPPPSHTKVKALEEGAGWDDSLSDDDSQPAPRKRSYSSFSVESNSSMRFG